MTTKEEQLTANYHRTKQELEEQEQTIQDFKRKGQRYLEENHQNLWHTLQQLALDSESLNEAHREYSQLEEMYTEVLDNEKRKILQKQDEVEQEYRQELRKLEEK